MARAPISFVIPAYNDAPGLRRHFDYFSRAGHPAELLVVDDGSTDETEQLVADAALPDHVTLRYHRNGQNRGPGASRNRGLDMASAPRLMFLDADDVLATDFFDYIALAPMDDAVDFILFKHHLCRDPQRLYSYDMHGIDNRFFSNLAASGWGGRSFALAELPSAIRTINFPWNKLYRTAFLRGQNIGFPDLRIHEDIRPHWQGFLRARRFGVLNWAPPLVHHIEEQGGDRATNYIGPDRVVAFDTMTEVLAEVETHPLAALIGPELAEFAADLLRWMCESTPALAEVFTQAAAPLFDRIGQHPDSGITATPMGHLSA